MKQLIGERNLIKRLSAVTLLCATMTVNVRAEDPGKATAAPVPGATISQLCARTFGGAKMTEVAARAARLEAAGTTNFYGVMDCSALTAFRKSGEVQAFKDAGERAHDSIGRMAASGDLNSDERKIALFRLSQLPGVYVQPDSGLIVAFDTVEAKWVRRPKLFKDGMIVFINPTRAEARVRLLAEKSDDTGRALSSPDTWPQVVVPAWGRLTVRMNRAGKIVTK